MERQAGLKKLLTTGELFKNLEKNKEFNSLKIKLIDYITQKAVLKGDFVLSSGLKSQFYIDLRRVTLDKDASLVAGELICLALKELENLNIDYAVKALGGLTLGADPVVCAAMAASCGKYNAFIVRKEPKKHGTGLNIEGPDISGKNICILEDVSSTGASALKALDSAKQAGGRPVCVITLLDRNQGAKELFNKEYILYIPLISINELNIW